MLGIDENGQVLPRRRGPIDGRRRSRTSCAAIYAARTEDKILYFKADKNLKYAQGAGGDRDRAPRRACACMAAITEPTKTACSRRTTEEGEEAHGDGNRRLRAGCQSEINVTPMIDVLLVLLIIFMITQPLSRMAIDVQVPPPETAAAANTPPPNQIVLELTATTAATRSTGSRCRKDQLDTQIHAIFDHAAGQAAVHQGRRRTGSIRT